MKTALLVPLLLLLQIPKNNPTGIWEAETGTQFDLRLAGSDVKVGLVEGSNPTYLKYEINLKGTEEVNTYKGSGYFLAKLKNGKECKFDTDWEIVVVAANRILGSAVSIIPDPDTCAVKEKNRVTLDLKKK